MEADIMNDEYERWNTPWQALQRRLAQGLVHGSKSHAAAANGLKSKNANWMVRARVARGQAGQTPR
jgi:hypothetical protein